MVGPDHSLVLKEIESSPLKRGESPIDHTDNLCRAIRDITIRVRAHVGKIMKNAAVNIRRIIKIVRYNSSQTILKNVSYN